MARQPGWGRVRVSVGVSVGMPVGLPDPRCGRCMQCRASAPPGEELSRPAPPRSSSAQRGSERHGTAWPGSCCWPGPRSWRPPPPRR